LTDGQKVRVGITGVTTPAIPNFEAPAHYAGMEFEDQIPVVKQCISELRARGVDLIIAATHSGVETDGRNSAENQVIGIARACPDADGKDDAKPEQAAQETQVEATGAQASKVESPAATASVIESGKDGKGNQKLDATIKAMEKAKTVDALDEAYIRAEAEFEGADLESVMRAYRRIKARIATLI